MKHKYSIENLPKNLDLHALMQITGGKDTNTVQCTSNQSTAVVTISKGALYSTSRKCSVFENCSKTKRRCAVKVLKAYGRDKWDYPDPRCVLAPEFNSGLEY